MQEKKSFGEIFFNGSLQAFHNLMEIWRLLRYCFHGRRKKGTKGDIILVTLEATTIFSFIQGAAAEVNNKEVKNHSGIQNYLQKRKPVCTLHSSLSLHQLLRSVTVLAQYYLN